MHLSCIENISLNASVEKSSENVDERTMNVSLCHYLTYTGPKEQTKYACPFSAVGRMSSLVFRSLHALSLG